MNTGEEVDAKIGYEQIPQKLRIRYGMDMDENGTVSITKPFTIGVVFARVGRYPGGWTVSNDMVYVYIPEKDGKIEVTPVYRGLKDIVQEYTIGLLENIEKRITGDIEEEITKRVSKEKEESE